MTFIAPALLALAGAVVVPLVLHLFRRDEGPRVVFPALRYLQAATQAQARRIRLRQMLLLALRVLAILLVAGAAARPFLPFGSAGHRPTSVVIVLDNSLSSSAVVGQGRVLDLLKTGALAALESAGPDDRFWLIRAGQPWEPAVGGDADRVRRAVDETVPGGGGSDLRSELDRAASILATEPPGRTREIHLLGDLQAGALEREDDLLPSAGDDLPALRVLRGPMPGSNTGVVAVEVGGGLPPRAGAASTVAATIMATGARKRDSVTARLVIGSSVVAIGRAAAGETLVLPFPARPPGRVTGHVEVDADALSGDDRRAFVVEVEPPPAVAATQSLPFLETALDVLAGAGRLRRAQVSAAAIVIAPGAVGARAARRGTAVLVMPPSSPLELTAANRRLEEAAIPWRFRAPAGGDRRFQDPDPQLSAALSGVRLRQVYGLEPLGTSADTVLLRLSDGQTWAVAGRTDAGRYVLIGSPLTTEAGTVPTSAAMVPLLDRMISDWARGRSGVMAHQPGEVVRIATGDLVLPPTGDPEPVRPGALYRLRQPGLYHVLQAGDTVRSMAVNPPAAESRTEALTEVQLENVLPHPDVRVAGLNAWPGVIYHQRLGHEATPALLIALLALLLVESGLAGSGAGRHATKASNRTRET